VRNNVFCEVDSENKFGLFNLLFYRISRFILQVIIPQNQGLKSFIIIKSFDDSFAKFIAYPVFRHIKFYQSLVRFKRIRKSLATQKIGVIRPEFKFKKTFILGESLK